MSATKCPKHGKTFPCGQCRLDQKNVPDKGILGNWPFPAMGHIPSITTSALSRDTSPHTCLEVFFLNPKSFSATKVRARIVRWNRRGSTSHLFDPNPRQDHDYLFKLPNVLGRQDAHSRSRS